MATHELEVDLAEEHSDVSHAEVSIAKNPSLDLDDYISSYSGLARLHRLLYIADHCPFLQVDALKMALSHVESTHNMDLYKMIHQKLLDASGDQNDGITPLNETLMEIKTTEATQRFYVIKSELSAARFNSRMDEIREVYERMSNHFLDCGDLNKAFNNFMHMKDYCSTPQQNLELFLNIVKVNIYLKNWSIVQIFQKKAERVNEQLQIDEIEAFFLFNSKIKCIAGLYELSTGNFKAAALNFLQTICEFCDIQELIIPNDIALYSGLCALASFSRKELKDNVIHNRRFQPFLELNPKLREIILHIDKCNFTSFLNLLDEIKDNVRLDIFIGSSVDAIYKEIRNQAIIQHFSAFSVANMWQMAQIFYMTIEDLEDNLVELIEDERIKARIDSQKKILYARDDNERANFYKHLIDLNNTYQKNAKSLILRAAVLRNNIIVTGDPSEDSG